MTYHRGPQNPDARANFEAALEFGVLPLAPADYSPMRPEEHRPVPVRSMQTPAKPVRRIVVASPKALRRTKKLVVTASDIMKNRGVV